MLLSHHPLAPLDAFVESIWVAERGALPHSRERSLPTGRADIVIPLLQDSIVRHDSVDAMQATHFRGGIVEGPRNRFTVRGMGGASSVIGVHFKPAGAVAFFGGALPGLRNRTVLLDDVWGGPARDLREQLQSAASPWNRIRLLEAHLLRRLPSCTLADAMVAVALQSLHRDPSSASIEPVQ